MESENEVSSGSSPPADHAGERADEPFDPETRDDLHLKSEMPNNGGGDRVRGNRGPHEVPHSEHKIAEMELREAQERIKELQRDLAHAEKKLADSQKESFEEISAFQNELSSTALAGQDKVKALESESARLEEELNASTLEVSDLRRHLELAKQDHGELLGQVDGLKEKVRMLEVELCDSGTKATKVEENLLAQLEACQTELHTKVADLESISKAHGELQLEIDEVKSKCRDFESALTSASKHAEEYQNEIKNQEAIAKEVLDESSRLKSVLEIAEAKCKEAEQTVKNLENELCETKAQILENDQVRKLLEETKTEKARIEEEGCQMKDTISQLEGHLADEKARVADLEGKIQNAEVELKIQEDRLKETEGIKEEVTTLGGRLIAAEGELKIKEEAVSTLQAEVVNLKTEVSELLRTSEDNLKTLEEDHKEQIKASEDRYEALQKSLSELEGKSAQLQDSLGVAGSDAEIARKRVAELELELENHLLNKSRFEEGAVELQLQLKSIEEMLRKQADSLKVAEKIAEKANEEVVQLQSVLSITEEKLRASEEVANSLQLQVTDLTSREATSAEHLKEVEDGLQTMQLEFQSKLEISEGNFKSLVSELEEKAAKLQESLAAAVLEAEGERKKVSDLELKLDSLHNIQSELEEKVRVSEEKCSQQDNSARTRGLELEGLITEHKTKADDANSKVVALEAALVDTQNKAADLEKQLKLAQDNSLLLESTSIARTAELERCIREYEAKVAEVEMACAGAKSSEQDTLEKLDSTEKMLVERQTEIDSATKKIMELELSITAMESDLKGALNREKLAIEEKVLVEEKILKAETLTEKLVAERAELESIIHQHKALVEKGKVDLQEASVKEEKLRDEMLSLQAAKAELQDLLSQIEIEKQTTIAQLDSTQKSFVELNEQLVEERQQLQQQIATIMQENGDLTQKFASTQETLHATLAAAEISAKQVQEGSLKESTLNAKIEDLNLQLRKALDACAHVETLEQENGNLAEKFARSQEKLDATLAAAEVSARELQEGLLTQSTLKAESEDLKVQLRKAMDACSQVEKLEQTLKNCITTEEHQKQIDQLLATSKLAESKLADAEEQLTKSKLEINKAQKAINEHETHVKELESKTLKSVESFDQQPSETTKTREIDVDSLSAGKVRNRKKKGVTWEVDGDATLKAKALEKPVQRPAHSPRQFVAHLLVAVLSLTMGFWLARKISV
eukprot:c10007_g1_i1 orf=420-4058(+)